MAGAVLALFFFCGPLYLSVSAQQNVTNTTNTTNTTAPGPPPPGPTAPALADGTCAVSPRSATATGNLAELSVMRDVSATIPCPNVTNGTASMTALVPCERVPVRFVRCLVVDAANGELIDQYKDDDSDSPYFGLPEEEAERYHCTRWGAGDSEIETTTARCQVLDGIECCGPRAWEVFDVPCARFSGVSFPVALVLSVFLGCFGVDRCYLGYFCPEGVLKCITLGAVGVWWIVDIILLIAGVLWPFDGSDWELLS
jgi:TM2 domain